MQELLFTMLRTATPILLAGLGGTICEKAGVMNLALEGIMLFGAFFGVVGSHITANATSGVLLALICGAVLGAVYYMFVEQLKADPMMTSIGINTLAAGLTSYLKRYCFGSSGIILGINGLEKVDIALLDKIPLIGPVLNGHTYLVYVAIVLTIVLQIVFYKTYVGINLRAVGEHPVAAASAGISVNKYRFWAVVSGCMLCGMAGAHLSLGYVTMFAEGMVGGRGFFAYTCVAFGQANPILVLFASFVFGLAENISYFVQGINVPSQFVLMIPYLCTIVALIIRAVNYEKVKRMVFASQRKN